jgi:hypothetical protein
MYTSVGSYARENAETGSAEIDHSADVPSANLLRVVLVSYIERVKLYMHSHARENLAELLKRALQ